MGIPIRGWNGDTIKYTPQLSVNKKNFIS